MAVLSRARVKIIQSGIESLSSPVLELMNKGTDAFQCIVMLKSCIKYGIIPAWNLLIGFPKMTGPMYESLLSVMPGLFHLFPPGFLNPLRIDRFSIYALNSKEYDLTLRPFIAYQYVYPYDQTVLAQIAYHFEDTNFYSQRYFLLTEYFPKLQAVLNEWTKRWQSRDVNRLPRLTFLAKDDDTYVFDSRQGNAKVYNISPLEEKVLRILETPLSRTDLFNHFPGEAMANLDKVIEQSNNHGLLFIKNNRLLSLVIRDYSETEMKFIAEKASL